MGSTDSSGFTVRTDVRNGVARLALIGELDMAVASTLEDELLRVQDDGVKAAFLDLGELAFMDSSGLAVLLRATNRARENGHHLAIVGVGGVPRRLLEISGTERMLLGDARAVPMIERFTRGNEAVNASEAPSGDGVG